MMIEVTLRSATLRRFYDRLAVVIDVAHKGGEYRLAHATDMRPSIKKDHPELYDNDIAIAELVMEQLSKLKGRVEQAAKDNGGKLTINRAHWALISSEDNNHISKEV